MRFLPLLLANLRRKKVRTVLTDRDGAWIDIHDDAVEWVQKGESFTWISERDGWRHLLEDEAPPVDAGERLETQGGHHLLGAA